MARPAIGVDLGGTTLKVGLVDRDNLLDTRRLDTEARKGPDHVVGRIVQGIRALSVDLEEIEGIGIGAPGAVNLEGTTVTSPPNFPGWKEVDVSRSVSDALSYRGPVIVDNDANVAALGSAFYGAGLPYDSFLMVTLGTGVGGGIIYRDELFRGTRGAAAEVGHISVDYDGPEAAAGIKGVIEAYIGQRFLCAHAAERLKSHPDSLVHQMMNNNPDELTPKMLVEAAEQGDSPARDILAWAGHKLGWGLGSAVNLLDIRKIVVGGGVSQAGDLILEPARKALREAVMPGLREGLEIVRETLGNQAGMLGAAQLVFSLQRPSGNT